MLLSYQHLYQGVTRHPASVRMLAHMLVHCQPVCVYIDVHSLYSVQSTVRVCVGVVHNYHSALCNIKAAPVVVLLTPMPEHAESSY
jgi:hypothetical protein